MDNLFGPSPWEIQQAQQQQIGAAADKYAAQDPFQRATAGMYRAGAGLARPVAGMLGGVNVAEDQARRTEQIMGQGDADLTTSKGLLAKAKQFKDMGDYRTATMLTIKAQEMKKQEQSAMLAERKQTFQEDEALKLKYAQLAQQLEIAKMRSEDSRIAAADRAEAAREANQIRLQIAQMAAESRKMAAEAKTAQTPKLSTYDAKSLERSDKAAEAANPALALLNQAQQLYGQYESSRTEPILGTMARVGAAFGMDKQRAADYETAGQIAKDLGVIKLGLIGGSDTERELQVAIDTAPSPDKTVEANQTIIRNQIKAIEILQSEPDFKREWIEKNGSLAKKDANTGESYGAAWRKFQKEKFTDKSPPPASPTRTTKTGVKYTVEE